LACQTTKTSSNKATFKVSKASGNWTKNSSYKNGFNPSVTASPFSMKLAGKGFVVEPINQKQGVVSVSGQAFRYDDKKSGLTSYYPTQSEAMQDGISPKNLEQIHLKDAQFIDLSTFNKVNPNPHNFNAMQEAKKLKKPINYAYVDKASPPQKVRNFLEMSKKRNEAYGIEGVIVERQAQKGSGSVVRIYKHKSYEKRTDI
jgi:phosphatidate phosphatase PAH1